MKLTSTLIEKYLGKTITVYAIEGHSWLGKASSITEDYVEMLVQGKVTSNSSAWNDNRTITVGAEYVIGILVMPEC